MIGGMRRIKRQESRDKRQETRAKDETQEREEYARGDMNKNLFRVLN